MSAETNVQAYQETTGASRADRSGCSARFEPVENAKVGSAGGEIHGTG